jgi:hypothetical protein
MGRIHITEGTREAVKKSGLPQAQAKPLLIRKDSGKARLAVPAFFHSFQPGEHHPANIAN